MLSETATFPQPDLIFKDLAHMTRRWGELGVKAWLEVRAFRDGKPVIAKFNPADLQEAVDWVEDMNGRGYSIYAVRNPIRYECTGAATDDDIIAAFFLWADCDDPAAAGNVLRFDGPKWSAAVVTGTIPHQRAHTYWELETACHDMTAWRRMQETIAAHFASDRSVVNPSRIMRVGGTVTYPAQHKLDKGYVKEVTSIRTEYDDDRPCVTLDQMARVFGNRTPATQTAPTDGFHIATGDYTSKDAEHYADILRRARTDGEKHAGVRDLAASLAGSGVPLAMAEAIIRNSCPVWDEGVETLIRTAYDKFFRPEPTATEMQEQVEAAKDWPTPLLDFDETALPRRQWIYGTDYIRKYVSVVASAGGVGKTSQAIVEAMAIITGKPLLGVEVKEPCNVWIVNLEDPREELVMRALAARKHYGIPTENLRGKLFLDGEDTIQVTLAAESREGIMKNDALLDAIEAKIKENEIGVVIFDPFVSTHLVNENSNASVQAVVAMFRDLARRTQASVSLVHHVRKGNGEDATIDSVRGAGSLIGAARAARVVNRLSEKEAETLDLKPKEARSIFRVDDGKANLAPPAESAVYRKMVGVQIDNGEWIGVCTPYELPDEWSGMKEDVVNNMLDMIRKGPARDDDSEEYYSMRPQDKLRWVGTVITDYPFAKAEDFKSTAQAKAIIKKWLENGLLEEVEYYSQKYRKDRKGVTAVGRVGKEYS